jgi:hypothetical protein
MMRRARAAAENAGILTSGKGSDGMAIGPVQLIVPGFDHPDFRGEIIAELERLRESDTVRVIDSLAVYKDADGELEVQHLSHLSTEEAIELGSTIDALIGLGIEGEEGVTKCFPAHPTTTKTLRLQGLRDAPKRTRTSTRLSRTRPSTWSPGCQMCPRRGAERSPASSFGRSGHIGHGGCCHRCCQL